MLGTLYDSSKIDGIIKEASRVEISELKWTDDGTESECKMSQIKWAIFCSIVYFFPFGGPFSLNVIELPMN